MLQVQTPARAAARAGLDGQSSIPLGDAAQSRLHLNALARPGMFLELRVRANDRWEKRFFEDATTAAQAAQAIKDAADCYVGVLPRMHAGYGGDALPEHGNVLWAEADNEAATARVLTFAPAAHLLIRSSSGRLHAYWFLDRLIPLSFVEQGNKRLAYHLGCDPRATNAGRILRVAGTRNHKRGEPERVAITRFDVRDNLTAATLVGGLPDPTPPRPIQVARTPLPPDADTEALRAIPARVYIPALTGVEVYHDKACCPFHEDRSPSLSVGGPNQELWICFGACDTGGDIFKAAALAWGLDERRDFPIIKQKLKEML